MPIRITDYLIHVGTIEELRADNGAGFVGLNEIILQNPEAPIQMLVAGSPYEEMFRVLNRLDFTRPEELAFGRVFLGNTPEAEEFREFMKMGRNPKHGAEIDQLVEKFFAAEGKDSLTPMRIDEYPLLIGPPEQLRKANGAGFISLSEYIDRNPRVPIRMLYGSAYTRIFRVLKELDLTRLEELRLGKVFLGNHPQARGLREYMKTGRSPKHRAEIDRLVENVCAAAKKRPPASPVVA